MKKWWEENQNSVYHLCIRDGKAISDDPFMNWTNGDTKDLIILQGHTTNEFQYYEHVFGDNKELYDAICEVSVDNHLETGNPEKKRVEVALKMVDLHPDYRYLKSFSSVLLKVAEKHPELFEIN